MRVDAGVAVRAKLFFQSSEDFVDRNFFGGEQFQEHQSSENSIPFRNVAGKTNSAAFFGAEQDVAFGHFSADIFEPDAGLDQRQSVGLAHVIDHRGRGEGFDDAASQATIGVKV